VIGLRAGGPGTTVEHRDTNRTLTPGFRSIEVMIMAGASQGFWGGVALASSELVVPIPNGRIWSTAAMEVRPDRAARRRFRAQPSRIETLTQLNRYGVIPFFGWSMRP
jgi:hypothetical protein